MSLEKKYGIASEIVNQLVVDGVIPYSIRRNHEIYDQYLKLKEQHPNKSNPEIYCMISDDRVSTDTIDKIVQRFGKK